MRKIWRAKMLIAFAFTYLIGLQFNSLFAISNEFLNSIDMLGVPRYNSNKEEINEEVYKMYNIFCYSAPETYSGTNPAQRWKDSKYGLWTKTGGSYKGTGIRGEYMVLGKNYGGVPISNFYFPLDTISPTMPDTWSYILNTGAAESWTNGNAYRFAEQRDYMKQAKLMFNDLSSRDNADNTAMFKEYNITSNSIGLTKAKLDTSSTWKSRGVVSVKFVRSGATRYAFFFTNPIAANANVQSGVNSTSNTYTIKEEAKDITIPIDYYADAINLTGYAKKEHIKQINSAIYINDMKVGEISGSKTTNVGSRYNFVVSRQTPNLSPNTKFVVRVDSYMYTEFAIDGVMKNSVSKTINVIVEPEKIEPLKTYSIKQIEKQDTEMVVRPLAQTSNTISKNSLGVLEAGRKAAIKLNLNILPAGIKNIKLEVGQSATSKVALTTLNILPNSARVIASTKQALLIDFEVPKETLPTIYGWESLREKNDSYFKARSVQNFGDRKTDPYTMFLEFEYLSKIYKYEFKIDITDDYISNSNYTLESLVTNKEAIANVQSVESWINNES